MAAEGLRGPWGTARICCFNGAAAGWPRKTGTRIAQNGGNELQWGRGRMAAEG